MGNKIVAVFLMCVVLAAAAYVQARVVPETHFHSVHQVKRQLTVLNPEFWRAQSADTIQERQLTAVPAENKFKSCFNNCKNECLIALGEYNCEMKCDTECSAKEFADKLHIKI